MSKLLSLSINVAKIDKSRLVVGEKGTYLSITVATKDEPDQYGNNVSCWESQTKDEREAKKERNFLGNGRILFSDDNQQRTPAEVGNNYSSPDVSVSADGLPF